MICDVIEAFGMALLCAHALYSILCRDKPETEMLCLSFNPHINILAVGKGRTAHSPANITMSRH
jgi:hypothetical protein